MHQTHTHTHTTFANERDCVLHQVCCNAAAHCSGTEENHTAHTTQNTSSSFTLTLFAARLYNNFPTVSPRPRYLSLSAVSTLRGYCCPARSNLRRELVETCKHIQHTESQSSGLAVWHEYCLCRGECKQIDWTTILQLLMLTHSVHYQQGGDAGWGRETTGCS